MPTCTQRVKKRQREEAGETARQRGLMRGMSSMVGGGRAETCLPRSRCTPRRQLRRRRCLRRGSPVSRDKAARQSPSGRQDGQREAEGRREL